MTFDLDFVHAAGECSGKTRSTFAVADAPDGEGLVQAVTAFAK